MADSIGLWFHRVPGQRAWHVVESQVAGDVVTKCGRRMNVARKPSEWNPEGVEPERLAQCYRCRGPVVLGG